MGMAGWALVAASLVAGCQQPTGTPREAPDPSLRGPFVPGARLKMDDLKVGTGAEAVEGKTVRVHYTGVLQNGTKFDSSRDRGEPISFVLGRGMVIPGWDQGILGMKVGGQRKLTIPPALAYGDRGAGPAVPPNATLIFDVELVGVE